MTQLHTTPSKQAKEFTDVLNDLIRVIQFRDRDRACCYGLSVSQCYALKAVCDDRRLGVNDLAAKLYLDKSSASRLVNGLVEAGMVSKGRDPEDGRIVVLEPTDQGRAVHRAIEGELVREYEGLLAGLDERGRGDVIRTLRLLSIGFSAKVETAGGSCCVTR